MKKAQLIKDLEYSVEYTNNSLEKVILKSQYRTDYKNLKKIDKVDFDIEVN